MEEVHVDLLTVLIAAVVYVIAGAIWYSPLLFGNTFKKLKGIPKNTKPKMWPELLWEFVTAFVMAFFLALVLGFLGATSTMDGIYVAIGIWFGFIAMTQLSSVIWGKTPFQLYLISVGFWFVGFVILGAILGA